MAVNFYKPEVCCESSSYSRNTKNISEADLSGYFNAITAILGDMEVMYAWDHAFTDDEIRDWIEENVMRYARDGYSYWAVALYAFDILQIPLLTAQIRPDNISSKKVADKLGMSAIKHFNRVYRGKSIPHILYGCSK